MNDSNIQQHPNIQRLAASIQLENTTDSQN